MSEKQMLELHGMGQFHPQASERLKREGLFFAKSK